MAARRCKDCGELVEGQWRCDRCKTARGMKPTRYNGAHQARRKRERPLMVGRPCYRCGRPLYEPMELDHHDDDPTKSDWSHKRCNRAARNRLYNNGYQQRQPRRTREPAPPALPAYEVEIEPGCWVLPQTPPRQHSRGW
jgi:hypothetical protein